MDSLLGLTAYPSPVEGDRLKLHDGLFHDGALVFDRLASHSVRYGVPDRRSLTASFPGMPHLGIWTKPGAGFLCIEPWQGYADPEDFEGELAEKPGVVRIPPGEAHRCKMEISVGDRE